MHPEDFLKVEKPCPQDARGTIIIPTWNNLAFLQLCIQSIRKNSSFRHQIIVHINEGTDGTREWVASQDDLSYTASSRNIGVCYALNLARSLVRTSYFIYLNDDMYVCPGWDQVLFDEIRAIGHQHFFLSSTAIEPVPQSSCSIRGNYGLSAESFDEEALLQDFEKQAFADWSGATWPPNIVHIDTWDLVGGYSIEFSPGMYSDPDFSMKLWLAGIRYFKGLAASRAYHFGSVSTKKVKKNKGYYQFIAKWGMTSSSFTRYYLRRGEAFRGALQEATPGKLLGWKNKLKQAELLFRKWK